MKKLFSRKSGFTLVEIIVAFAVFAIMAAMVSSIMALALHQRSENMKFADEVEEQKDMYARFEKDLDYGDSTASGSISLKFVDRSTATPTTSTYAIDYIDKSVIEVEGAYNSKEGINYFVGNADYEKTSNPAPGKGDSPVGSNSLVDLVDSYIYGSPNFESIRVSEFKALSASEAAATGVKVPDDMTMYVLEIDPIDSADALVNEDLIVWRGLYVRMPEDVEIYDCGYIYGSSYTKKSRWLSSNDKALPTGATSWSINGTPVGGGNFNNYEIVKSSDSTVYISLPQSVIFKKYSNIYGGYHFKLNNGGSSKYYLILDTKKTTFDENSFGTNGKTEDGNVVYTAYEEKDKDGNTVKHVNVYGAKPRSGK